MNMAAAALFGKMQLAFLRFEHTCRSNDASLQKKQPEKRQGARGYNPPINKRGAQRVPPHGQLACEQKMLRCPAQCRGAVWLGAPTPRSSHTRWVRGLKRLRRAHWHDRVHWEMQGWKASTVSKTPVNQLIRLGRIALRIGTGNLGPRQKPKCTKLLYCRNQHLSSWISLRNGSSVLSHSWLLLRSLLPTHPKHKASWRTP